MVESPNEKQRGVVFFDKLIKEGPFRASAVLDRRCQAAFRAAVYLLRRTVNLSLREVGNLAGVSTPRVETSPDGDRLNALMERYQVKH